MNTANSKKHKKTKRKGSLKLLLEKEVGPLTLGKLLEAIRLGEEWTMEEMAKKLGITRSSLNDIEKGRKNVSVERASRYATILGYSKAQFIRLALQSQLDQAGLEFTVDLNAA